MNPGFITHDFGIVVLTSEILLIEVCEQSTSLMSCTFRTKNTCLK